jgi:hypothetical protein
MLPQRVGESAIEFFPVHAKKLDENRVPDVIMNKLVIPCLYFSDRQKGMCLMEM